MKQLTILVLAILTIGMGWQSAARAGMDHSGQGGMDMSKDGKMGSMSFKHIAVDQGIRAEFEIMSLAAMGTKPTDGSTHHIMLKLFHDSMNHQIKKATGKVKIIAPDKSDQVSTIQNYNGVFAATLALNQKGKYGVICLLKVQDKKVLYKFWYTLQ